jgi:hypothetical protein
MGERNMTETPRALPQKIEQRLTDLMQLDEFDQGDVAHCRRTYWGAREDWHQILIDCHAAALERHQRQPAQTIPRASASTAAPT